MKLSDFNYILPEDLIAQSPLEKRDYSRLLNLDSKSWEISEKKFFEIEKDLSENDVLVLNETRVINARLRWKIDVYPNWKKKTKDIEIFLHKQISIDTWEILGPWNNLKIWKVIRFYNKDWVIALEWEVMKVSEMWRFMRFNKNSIDLLNSIEELWEMPLPPYIKEKLENNERYQTVFSRIEGSAAAPTAWLHFTDELLRKLENKWVKIEKVLLHVWVWTFKPVEVENVENHYMHYEYIEIEEKTTKRLNQYKKENKRIIAVWTTCVRVLESFTNDNWVLEFGSKETNIFIYPWYNWKFVDSIITNFHLPKSTLLMLVSSFAWIDNIKKAYEYAIKKKFRFFSFWDAMWINNKKMD